VRRLAIALLLFAATAKAETFTLDGFFTARHVHASGPNTWLNGGTGRLPASDTEHFGIAQVGASWTPSLHFGLHAQGIARSQPAGYGGRQAGLVEAYADAHFGGLTLRGGQFFLGTSRENVDLLWNSPYTINYSALNSWIGEEFRPLGVDATYKINMLTIGGTAFRDNDTMGTLLAWRGWDIGSRLTVYDETLPLTPPPQFIFQMHGTRPFEKDLDGHTGYSERVRYGAPDKAIIQLTHVDNRGDRARYGAEYSWATRFTIASAQVGNVDTTALAAEYMWGKTAMGFRPRPVVEADVAAGYVLLSHVYGKNRFSARYDIFNMIDRAHAVPDTYDEHGRSWTLTWLHDLTTHLRAGAEYTQVTGHREDPFDGRAVTLDIRYWLHVAK
jgi:hypothetical protein